MSSSSLLWQITPPEGQSSWLFGTMHIRDSRAHNMAADLYPLIRNADHYIGEMDLSEPSLAQSMPVYDARKYFSEKKLTKIRHQLQKSFEVDLAAYNSLHPLMIMGILSTAVLKTEQMTSLDEHLWEFAEQQGKPVSGLESYEEQFAILHTLDVAPLYKQLEAISTNPSKMRRHALHTIRLYMQGDIHALYMLSKGSMRELRKTVIYERNKKMSSVITQLDMSLQYFITVGAGHLSGKYGLISLLRRNGWKVNPVRQISL